MESDGKRRGDYNELQTDFQFSHVHTRDTRTRKSDHGFSQNNVKGSLVSDLLDIQKWLFCSSELQAL